MIAVEQQHFISDYTTYKTVLPPEVKLTPYEIAELSELEEQCDRITSVKPIHKLTFDSSRGMSVPSNMVLHFSFIATTNVGVHYMCVERNIALRVLSNNLSLSKEMILLIFRRNQKLRGQDKEATEFNLLAHKNVYTDLDFFKTLYNQIMLDTSIRYLLNSIRGYLAYTPINILMFMLHEVVLFADEKIIQEYAEVAIRRKEMVLEWVAQNEPELAGLPLSWVLKVYGINGVSE